MTDSDPDHEDIAPEGMRIYNITAVGKHTDLDGKWWLYADADDGTTIVLANLAEGRYEVIVEGPHEPGGWRHYGGGLGSPAHGRFEKYLRLYEKLLTPQPETRTLEAQDESPPAHATPRGRGPLP